MISNIYWIHLPEHTNIFEEGYIGVSINPKKRLVEHKKRNDNPHLTNALKKHTDIIHTILLVGEENYCYELENILRPKENIGWNINCGGAKPPNHKGKHLSAECRRKQSEYRQGRPLSKEHSMRISQGKMGHVQSEETKRKISESKKGQICGMVGKKHSEETKLKISNSKKGCIGPNLGKRMSDEQKRKISETKKRKFLEKMR